MVQPGFTSSAFRCWPSQTTAPFRKRSFHRGTCSRSIFPQNVRHHHAGPRILAAQSLDRESNQIHNDTTPSNYPEPRRIPALLRPYHFINLTNGIEALSNLSSLLPATELRFTRIQSSHCESRAYEKILLSLDNELLFALACGRSCFLYDFASRNRQRGVPRSLFLGLEFIKWSLAYLWFHKTQPNLVSDKVMIRGSNTVPFWRDEVMGFRISRDAKKKIRYFEPYAREMGVTEIKLFGIYGRVSDLDGQKQVHVQMVRDWVQGQAGSAEGSETEQVVRQWHHMNGHAEYRATSSREELIALQKWMQKCDTENHDKHGR